MAGFYLHYWYADYQARNNKSLEIYDLHNIVKQYMGGLEVQATKRILAANVGDVSNFGTILTFLEGKEAQDLRKQVFDSNLISTQQSAIKTMNQIKEKYQLSNAELSQKVDLIAKIVDDFQKSLDDFLKEAMKKLDTTLDEYKKLIIEEYAAKKNIDINNKGSLHESILNDFLQHQGIVKLNLKTATSIESSNAALQSSLRSLVLLAEALPDYGEEKGTQTLSKRKYSTGKTKGKDKMSDDAAHTLDIIAGKCTGLFNNIVGIGGEIAVAIAERSLEDNLNETLKKLNKTIEGKNCHIIAEVVGNDVKLEDSTEFSKTAKGDVRVKIVLPSSDGKPGNVLIDYGISAKTFSFDKSSHTASVSITKDTSFLDAFNRYTNKGKDYGYLYHIIGSHEGKGRSEKGKNINIPKEELVQAWNSLRDAVVVSNFLDILAGTVGEQQTALYVNFNGIVRRIDDILTDIKLNPSMLSIGVKRETTKNGNGTKLARTYLSNKNTWVYEKTKKKNKRYDTNTNASAQIRSDAAMTEIRNTLQNTKLTVALNYDLKTLGLIK